MTRVNQFFREVSTALHTPAVRTALKQAGKQVEAQLVRDVKRFADGFSAARPTPCLR